MRLGLSNDDLFALTKIDPWFLEQIRELMQFEALLVGQAGKKPAALEESLLWEAKELGFSDDRIAQLIGVDCGLDPEAADQGRPGQKRGDL